MTSPRRLPSLGPLVAVVVLLLITVGVYLGSRGPERIRALRISIDENATNVLDNELVRALEQLEALDREPLAEGGDEALEQARLALLRIRDFYLPLLAVRESARNALGQIRAGQRDQAAQTLERAESILLEVGHRGYPQLSRELEPLLEHLVDVRSAVAAERPEAVASLEQLDSRIEVLLLRGDLALQATRLRGS